MKWFIDVWDCACAAQGFTSFSFGVRQIILPFGHSWFGGIAVYQIANQHPLLTPSCHACCTTIIALLNQLLRHTLSNFGPDRVDGMTWRTNDTVDIHLD